MRSRRSDPKSQDSIVSASVQMLEGHAVDLYRESGHVAPAWTYLNALAHSDPGHLATLTAPARFLDGAGWDAAIAYLATELLGLTQGRPENISLTQRAILVPLEVALLGHEVDEPETPTQLAHLVIHALYRQRTGDPRTPQA